MEDVMETEGTGQTAPEDTAGKSGVEEAPLERNLREVGLAEALPHQSAAPQHLQIEKEGEPEDGLPKIRTYAADMSEEMKKRGSTLSTIIGAEKARIPNTEAPAASGRNWRPLLLTGAILFILVGTTAVAAVFFLRARAPNAPLPAITVIPVNHHAGLAISSTTPLSQTLAAAKAGAQIHLSEMEAFDITRDGVALSPQEILTELGAPDELARNATDVVIGVHSFDHLQPFIIISVSAYDRSFQAMLAWEKTIGDSLGVFFAPFAAGASARSPVLAFGDRVSANIDVRESQAEWPILYAFPRQNLLVITTNENTLREILTRLSLQSGSNQ